MDGSSTKDRSGVSLIIKTAQRKQHEHALKFMFKASNNKIEYEALILGIDLCYTEEEDSVKAYLDS